MKSLSLLAGLSLLMSPTGVAAAGSSARHVDPPSPTSGAAPLLVSFTVYPHGTGPFTLDFTFGDGTTLNTTAPDGNARTVTHTYSVPGTYSCRLTTTDSTGETIQYTFAPVTVTGSTTPSVSVAATDASAGEPSNPGVFTVSRTGSTASALTVNLTRGGTATNGTDYGTIGATVTIGAGSGSATVTVTPIDDTALEVNETVVVTVASGAGYTVGSPSSATVTIADNDSTPATPTVTVAATDASAEEPSNTGTITVSRTGSTTSALTVNLQVSGTAANGADYGTIGATATIGAGSGSATVTVTPIDDTTAEGSETVVVTVASNSGYAVGSPSSATVTIADNDASSVLLIGSWRLNEMGGTVANDSSSSGNHASVIGSPMWMAGQYDGALHLDGVNDYLDVPDNSSVHPQEVTLAVWIYPMARGRYWIIDKAINTGTWSSFMLALEDTGTVQFSVQRSGLAWPTWVTTAEVPLNTWTHVAATFRASAFDATDGAVYINGSPAATTFGANGYASGFTIQYTDISLSLARRQSSATPGYYFNGMIDDARIYASKLTASDVGAVFAAGEDGGGSGGALDTDGDSRCGATGFEAIVLLGLAFLCRRRAS